MKMKITLQGVSYEVDVEVLEDNNCCCIKPPSVTNLAESIKPMPTHNVDTTLTSVIANNNHKTISAPVGGTIIDVKFKNGDKITKGETVIILEAMKMHTNIDAPIDATIKNIKVSSGEVVKNGQLLVEFE